MSGMTTQPMTVQELVNAKPDDDGGPIKLTPKQKKAWEDTMSLMAWNCPGFRHLFYKLLSDHNGEIQAIPTKRIPVAATDGKSILINPDTFFDHYNMQERVFIMGHEVVHNVFRDVPFFQQCRAKGTVPMNDGTTVPYDETSMQHAADYRINALLKQSRIGKPPEGVLLDDDIAKADDALTDVYKKVYEKYESEGTLGKGGFDVVLVPSNGNGSANDQQWAVETKAAQTLEAMRSQGKMAGALQRMFEQVLNPQIPWTDHIQGIFNKKVGSGSYNWRKPDRRFITRDLYMPSRSGNGAGWVVVWCDTSGSIQDVELCQYLAEIQSIVTDCAPQRLSIVWCDADVHRVDDVADAGEMQAVIDDVKANGSGGGGGTDIEPFYEWIDNQVGRPEVMLCFTDGYFSCRPSAPDFTAIWACTTEHAFPWGEVVRIHPKPNA